MPVGLSHPVDERCRQIEGQADQRSVVNTETYRYQVEIGSYNETCRFQAERRRRGRDDAAGSYTR